MDITIPQKDLLRILACHEVCDKRSPVPVLANVLLTAADGKLTAQATDLYLAMRDEAPAQVGMPGSIALPGKSLFDCAKHMPIGDVTLRIEGTKATLRAVGTKRYFDLQGIPANDFPPMPKPDGERSWEVSSDVLRSLINGTHFSIGVATQNGRDYALVEVVGNQIRMVSTDGHRLSKMEGAISVSPANVQMCIPLSGVQALRKFVEAKGAMVKFQQSGASAFFTVDSATLAIKLVDGGISGYEHAIPKPEGQVRIIQCPRHVLIDSLRAVQIATDNFGGAVLHFGPKSLRFESKLGGGGDEIDLQSVGPEAQVGMNVKYLLDALGAVNDAEVSVGVENELRPLSITADGFVAVVMAMSLD